MNEEIVEFIEEVGGLYFRSIYLPSAGQRVAQHVHDYDHVTYCGAGRAMLRTDGIEIDVLEAGHALEVKAGHIHEFEALEDGTRLTCIHNLESAALIKERGT